MMNAKEAKTLTNEFITKETAQHINWIENAIVEAARKGLTSVDYGAHISKADSRVKAKVWEELESAGYKVRWTSDNIFLRISWAEA